MEGRGIERGTRGKQDGHYRDFQEGRKAGNVKEVGLGWINLGLGWINWGRKDRGFVWGKIGGGEQLF